MAVELLSTRTVAVKRPAAVEEAPTPQAFTPAYVPAREYGESSPEVVAEPAAAVEEEALPAAEEHQVEPSSVPSMSPASAEHISAPLGTRRRYGMDAELPVPVSSDEERRLHNDARRFARLLISEIKLYNEQKVKDGRSEHDLYERLREYIDRSRDMYDKRVKPEVAKKYDYFHHELVGTLAEGDADKLGTAYPGAAVSA
jgi:hypothetical protein